jgi:DNA replication and repair protein RecF
MNITSLILKNFRNHKSFKAVFNTGTTLITGANGIGKTNIIEAIYVLATGKSHRARYDKDMINYEHTFCSISGKAANHEDEYDLELQILKNDNESNISSKKAKINKVVKSVTAFTGIFNAVMFSPEDISIITGSPAERRRFLDLILSQSDKQYKRDLSQYVKAVRQRNKLLELINKEGRGYNQIGFWDQKITDFSQYLGQKRTEFIEYLNTELNGLLQKLEHKNSKALIIYKNSPITSARIENYREKEIAAKSTLIGPHREDFEIEFNGHNIAEFGSRGQQRTLLLSLKLLEIGFIEKTKGERPVLLLDDIFSELDELHRQTITEVIKSQQTFITSAEPLNMDNVDVDDTIAL